MWETLAATAFGRLLVAILGWFGYSPTQKAPPPPAETPEAIAARVTQQNADLKESLDGLANGSQAAAKIDAKLDGAIATGRVRNPGASDEQLLRDALKGDPNSID